MNRNILTALVAGAAILAFSPPSHALTSKECSAKYRAAQSAGTLGEMKYADFRKAECGSGASPVAGPASSSPPSAPAEPAPSTARAPRPTTPPSTGAGQAVFPNAIASSCASEKEGKARMCTCLAQYKANKQNGGNGGLKWIQKGGGYYSQCNARLKGQKPA